MLILEAFHEYTPKNSIYLHNCNQWMEISAKITQKNIQKWGPWHNSRRLLIHWVQKRFWRMSLSYQIAPFLLLCLYLISLLSLGFFRIEISIWDFCNNEDQSVSFCIIGIRAIACKWVPLGFLHFKRHSILHIFI